MLQRLEIMLPIAMLDFICFVLLMMLHCDQWYASCEKGLGGGADKSREADVF